MTKFVKATSPSTCSNTETVLILLDTGMFVVVHAHTSCLYDAEWSQRGMTKVETNCNFFASPMNEPIEMKFGTYKRGPCHI